MGLKKRDWLFLALAAAVVALFIGISGEGTTTRVPRDEIHQEFYDLRAAGTKKIEVDALCEACHDGVQIPFPPDHPAKPGASPMRCLFCHKLENE
ncbi:MAG: cytochrome C [Desulfuromonadales bacterium]|nr:cytochrome C [Desulfuromonadales bacterium]